MKRLSVFALWIMALSGCSKYYYNPAPQVLPQYISKVAVRPFANHTQQYGLEDKLTLAVQAEFNRDGRYQITTEDQADGVVIGDITKYILEPLSYDQNHVPTEYKLWILVDVTFYDKVKNQSLWKEANMTGELRYFAASSGITTSANTPLAGSLTEDEARQTIWDQLSRDIRTRVFEGFGTVTGASDKNVGHSSPEQYNALPGQPVDNPPPVPPQQPRAPSPPQQPY